MQSTDRAGLNINDNVEFGSKSPRLAVPPLSNTHILLELELVSCTSWFGESTPTVYSPNPEKFSSIIDEELLDGFVM